MTTIVDVANKARVSPMTVSRYFNQPELLKPSTRDRVAAAVEALGYIPNHAARSLVSGTTKAVSLVLADITNPFYTTLARGVEDVAQANGYALTLGNADETLEKELRYVNSLISRRVDGVVFCPSLGGEEHVEMLIARSIPVVLVDRVLEDIDIDSVRGDTYAGGRMLVEHLLDASLDLLRAHFPDFLRFHNTSESIC